jgi:hypothetical protein
MFGRLTKTLTGRIYKFVLLERVKSGCLIVKKGAAVAALN